MAPAVNRQPGHRGNLVELLSRVSVLRAERESFWKHVSKKGKIDCFSCRHEDGSAKCFDSKNAPRELVLRQRGPHSRLQ
eukprot:7385127-Pyramimonas_sp.AAC.1